MNSPLLTLCKRFLRSPRVILAELAALALTGVLGAALPQAATASAPDLARLRDGPKALSRLIDALALDHVFRSPWFLGITVLTAASLCLIVVEQVRRLRRSWRQVLTESHFRDAPFRAELERPAGRAVTGAGTHRAKAPQSTFWTSNRLALAGSPLFHAGLLLVMLAGGLRALFGVDAAVDVLEGETIAPTAQEWAAQWPGLLAKPFRLEAPLRLQALDLKRYENGDLQALTARLVVQDKQGPRNIALAVNRDAHAAGGRLFLTTEFGPAALLEWQGKGGAIVRQAALLSDQGRGTFECSASGPGGLVAHLRALVDKEGRHPPSVEVHLMKDDGLLLAADAQVGQVLSFAGGERLTVRGIPFWARLRGSRDPALALAYTGLAMIMAGVTLLFGLIKVDGCIVTVPQEGRERVLVALKPQRFAPLFKERFENLVREQGGPRSLVSCPVPPQPDCLPDSKNFPRAPAVAKRLECAELAPAFAASAAAESRSNLQAVQTLRAVGARAGRAVLLVALCLALTACRPASREQARRLVERYNQVVAEAYRRGDVKLIDPVVGPNEGKKLTGLIGVRLDMGLTLDSRLLSLEVRRVEQEPKEMRVWTDERWLYCDRRVGTGQQVGEASLDTYQMLYVFKKLDQAWMVDEIKFNTSPKVSRKHTPWPAGDVTRQPSPATPST